MVPAIQFDCLGFGAGARPVPGRLGAGSPPANRGQGVCRQGVCRQGVSGLAPAEHSCTAARISRMRRKTGLLVGPERSARDRDFSLISFARPSSSGLPSGAAVDALESRRSTDSPRISSGWRTLRRCRAISGVAARRVITPEGPATGSGWPPLAEQLLARSGQVWKKQLAPGLFRSAYLLKTQIRGSDGARWTGLAG